MEVMAEANEQPALLNQRVDQNKKPRRPRNATGAGKLSTAKSGVRKAKRPMKAQEPDSAEISNNSARSAPVEEFQESDPQISLPLPAADEKAPAVDDSPEDRERTDSNEMAEHAAVSANASPKFLEASPAAVDIPKHEPVFGE